MCGYHPQLDVWVTPPDGTHVWVSPTHGAVISVDNLAARSLAALKEHRLRVPCQSRERFHVWVSPPHGNRSRAESGASEGSGAERRPRAGAGARRIRRSD